MELPSELFDEILIRVPVRYLLRCRCVSKKWCYVIDSTEFVKKHFKASIEMDRGGNIIQGLTLDSTGRRYLLADLESFDNGSAIIDLGEEVGRVLDGTRVAGSVNGLVCLYSTTAEDMDLLFLLNPCTRKCKKLPLPGTEFLDNNNLLAYFLGGFGYDHVSDDYKVVLMVGSLKGIMAIVYSLAKNSWTPISDVFIAENVLFNDIWGTFADGLLLWKAYNISSMSSLIVGFDLGLEQFMEAGHCNVLPTDICMENSQSMEILANPVFRSFRSARPLAHLKSLKKILFEVDNEYLVWYHYDTNVFENVTIPGFPYWFYSHRYIESLFPLIEDRQPSHEAKEKKELPKKRFLTIGLVLHSVIGCLMFLIIR